MPSYVSPAPLSPSSNASALAAGQPTQIDQRNRAPVGPSPKKMARADFVLWNEGGLTILGEQLDRILRRLNP